jgi:hypothetical protein
MSLYTPANAIDVIGFTFECRHDGVADAGGMTAPDAGAGGGDEPPMETPAQTEDASSPDRADAAPPVADGDDDEDGLTDEELADLRNDPRVKRVLNRNRKLSRRLAEARPTLEQMRAYGVKDLREIVRKAEDFDRVQPLLRQQRSGGETSRAAQPPQEYQPPPFDRNSVPFDTNDAGGRWIVDYAEQQHNTVQKVIGVMHLMARELHTLREGHQGELRSREVTNWRGEIDKASKLLPEKVNGIPVRTLFADAVIGAFHQARVTNRRIDPAAVITHYLKEFSAQKKNPAALTAAAQQRIAENNRTLPGRQAFAGGTPAEARNRKEERVKDVTKRLLGGRRW